MAPGGSAPAHLLQLGAGGHLLGEQRGLDAVEQPFEPADELRVGDAELGLAGGGLGVGERQRDALQLLDQLRREAVLELLDRTLVDLRQARAAGLVEGGLTDLLEQLPDHAADAHDLGRLLDHLGDRALLRLAFFAGRGGHAVLADDDDMRILVVVAHWIVHGASVSHCKEDFADVCALFQDAVPGGRIAHRDRTVNDRAYRCRTPRAARRSRAPTRRSRPSPRSGRPRSPVEDDGGAPAHQLAEVELGDAAALKTDDHESAAGAQRLHITRKVLRRPCCPGSRRLARPL